MDTETLFSALVEMLERFSALVGTKTHFRALVGTKTCFSALVETRTRFSALVETETRFSALVEGETHLFPLWKQKHGSWTVSSTYFVSSEDGSHLLAERVEVVAGWTAVAGAMLYRRPRVRRSGRAG